MPPELVLPLQAVALGGPTFDLIEFRAATALDAQAGDRVLDVALQRGLIEIVTGGGFRFTDDGTATELFARLTPHRPAAAHQETAGRLIEANASPERPLRHLLLAGDYEAARWLPSATRQP